MSGELGEGCSGWGVIESGEVVGDGGGSLLDFVLEEAVEQEDTSIPRQVIAGECDSDVLGAATMAHQWLPNCSKFPLPR